MVVPVNLPALVTAAANLYRASGSKTGEQAAALMNAAMPARPPDPPQTLAVLKHLHSITARLPGAGHAASLFDLPWTDGGFVLPMEISGRNAYAEVVGPDGPLRSEKCRFGFYLQAPNCLYPAHSHAAEELYLILSGMADWRLDGAAAFRPGARELVHHLPWQSHEMRTGSAPLLALWVWLGDLSYATYSI